MRVRIAGGATEDGIVVGNTFDKYGSTNPLVKWMMRGFDGALSELVARAAPQTIHEVGCGEGYWVMQWLEQGFAARGCDFSTHAIELARLNASERGLAADTFAVRSIYDLQAEADAADLVVCCEVLEHLDDPAAGLRALQRVVTGHLIVSVPREPLWRVLNLARGKYVRDVGNTPGHLQHWSKPGFVRFMSTAFEVLEIRSPLPWTMLLCRRRAEAR